MPRLVCLVAVVCLALGACGGSEASAREEYLRAMYEAEAAYARLRQSGNMAPAERERAADALETAKQAARNAYWIATGELPPITPVGYSR